VLRPLYILTATYLGVGTVLLVLAPWLLLRVVGGTIAGVGLLFSLMFAWLDSGAAARWALWRKNRWIRKRQRELGRSPRPSA
jgi:hypothetical protein